MYVPEGIRGGKSLQKNSSSDPSNHLTSSSTTHSTYFKSSPWIVVPSTLDLYELQGWAVLCETTELVLSDYLYPLATKNDRDGYVRVLLRAKRKKGKLYVAVLEQNT